MQLRVTTKRQNEERTVSDATWKRAAQMKELSASLQNSCRALMQTCRCPEEVGWLMLLGLQSIPRCRPKPTDQTAILGWCISNIISQYLFVIREEYNYHRKFTRTFSHTPAASSISTSVHIAFCSDEARLIFDDWPLPWRCCWIDSRSAQQPSSPVGGERGERQETENWTMWSFKGTSSTGCMDWKQNIRD